MQTKTNFKKRVANFFGAIGYFFITMQWLWAIMLYTSSIEAFTKFISPTVNQQVVKPPTTPVDLSANMPMTIIVAAITIIVVSLTVYILIRMPSTIAKTSNKVVHEAVETATPVVLHLQHRQDTKRNHKRLTSRLIVIMKIILVIVPVILSFASQFIEKQMIDFSIAMYASFWLAGVTVIFFALQYFLAKLLSVARQDLR